MKFTRTSPFSNKTVTLDLDVTADQLEAWQAGELIQHAMPHLNADQREFLITGIAPGEWEQYIGSNEEETYDQVMDDNYDDEENSK